MSSTQGINYLHRCFHSFREVIERKYPNKMFDLAAIEKSVKHLRRKAPLLYSNLARFESPNHWWFEKFWVFPPEDQISPALKRRELIFGPYPKGSPRSLSHSMKSFDQSNSSRLSSVLSSRSITASSRLPWSGYWRFGGAAMPRKRTSII